MNAPVVPQFQFGRPWRRHVAAWGNLPAVPAEATNVVAITGGCGQAVALRADGMKPAEEADAMEVFGEDVLEEAADQFDGFQIIG